MTDAPRWPRWLWLVGVVAFAAGWFWLHDERGDQRSWRMGMSLFGAALLILRGFLGQIWQRRVGLVLILWALIIVGAMLGRPMERLAKKGSISEWSFFHYYLGAKYFAELGYDGLYDQAVLVDSERSHYWRDIPLIRNLDTYAFEPLKPETRTRRAAWTDARWDQFGEDIEYFLPHLRKRWHDVLTDRGYNATPTWNTTGWLLAQLPATKWGLAVYGSVDTVLLLLAFGYFCWAFGPLWGLLGAAWCLLFYGNQGHVVGRPFLHDYLAALLVFAGATYRGKPRTAAVALAYAAMVRIFPGFFLGGLGMWTVLQWRATGALPAFTKRFAPAFVLTCALLAGYGCLNGRGVGAWVQFLGNISLHSEDHRFGGRRIGLQHFYTHDVSAGVDWDARYRRRDAWEKQETLWKASAAAMCLLWLVAMLRVTQSDPLDAMLLSMAVVFAVIVLSRYYWGAGALFFVLGARGRDGPFRGVVTALLFVQIAIFYAMKNVVPDDTFPWFVVANLCWGLWFVFLLVARIAAPTVPTPEAATAPTEAAPSHSPSALQIPPDAPPPADTHP